MASAQAPQPADYDSDADTLDKELDWLIENEEEKDEKKQIEMSKQEKQENKKNALGSQKQDNSDSETDSGETASSSGDSDSDQNKNDEPQTPRSNSPKSPRPDSPISPQGTEKDSDNRESPPTNVRPSSASDDDHDDYNGEYSDDQKKALDELRILKLDLGYTEDEAPPEYDVTERVRQLNKELAQEPDPEEEDRQRQIKFKENPVDLVVPPPDYPTDEEEDIQQKNDNEAKTNGEEKSNIAERSGQTGGADSSVSKVQDSKTRKHISDSEQESGTNAGEKNGDPNKQNERTKSTADDEKIVVERNGKFDMVNAKDLSPEERQMYLMDKADSDSGSTGSHEPHPPANPRPATANGGSSGGSRAPKARRAQSAQPISRGNEMDDFNYTSPYALSPEDKKRLEKQKQNEEEKQKKDKDRKKREEEDKSYENNDAFQCWLKKKRDQARRRRQEDEEANKEKENKKDKNDKPSSDCGSSEHDEKDPESAYNEWVKVKKQQRKQEKQSEKERGREIDEGWYVRPRRECNKAYKEWLKKKNEDAKKQQAQAKQKAGMTKLLQRRSRKSLALARAIKQAQSYKYVDYYGYRF